MATQVYEDDLDLDLEVLEATPLMAGGPLPGSYPFPFLSKTEKRQSVSARVVILENPLLKCVLAPSLGGRIVNLLDKRTGKEVVSHHGPWAVYAGGPRGVESFSGLRWRVLAGRANDLGPVEFQLVEPQDSDEPGAIIFHELAAGMPVSAHATFLLRPERAEIQFELKTFNRSFLPLEIAPQFLLPGDMQGLVRQARVDAFYDETRDVGLGILFPMGQLRGTVAQTAEVVTIHRFPERAGRLGPRQLDTWTGSILPVSGLDGLDAISEHGALSHSPTTVRISMYGPSEKLKLVIQPEKASALEAILAGGHGPHSLGKPSERGDTLAMVLLDEAKKELLRWQAGDGFQIPEPEEKPRRHSPFEMPFIKAAASSFAEPESDEILIRATQELGLRAAALSALGIRALRAGSFAEAAALFDDALLYNAEDHLTWWAKALAVRHSGADDSESQELLNAHFLAPLEPVLRAEAYLRQSQSHASPSILKPIAGDADALAEIACLLYAWGLFGDLMAWVHAALQLREMPMLRYILAAAMLDQEIMKGEAASEVRIASEKPINPPYPWRSTEGGILRRLAKRFPEDIRIKEMLGLFEWGVASPLVEL